MRSSVTLKQFMYEIRHESNIEVPDDLFPDGLLFKWIHKDILETILRLGGVINNLYRTTASIAVTDNAAHYNATASHVASATTVTGFTGLTPDVWIGGSIITVVSDVLYCAQITDNDATTVTISVGTDLPEMTSQPCFLSSNNSKKHLSLAGITMLNFPEPIWEVLDSSGKAVEEISLELGRSIDTIVGFTGEVYWYQQGQTIQLALGSGATATGNFTVGYYEHPTEATALTDYIDFPVEYHDLAQQRTMIRILKKKGQYDRAKEKEIDLEDRLTQIEKSNLEAHQIDRTMGERY